MSISIIQPDESQTFLFKYGPYGEEHQFNIKEILQKMRNYYQQNFDSVILLPYAYEAFGYFIAGCQIGSGSDDSMYLANEDYTLGIGYNQFIAVRPLYSNTMPMCAFNTDGTLSYSFGTVSMSTYYDGAPDYYIWNYFGGNYSQPYVMYTECSCNHLYINGEEYKFGDATCKVTYFLPDDEYEYTKLTYKRDVKPESVNDGTIVNLDPSQDYINVEGLVENASYWFKIFTSKSESEAFPYTVREMPTPPYEVANLEIMKDPTKEWKIQNYNAYTTVGLYINFSANRILDFFSTYLTVDYHYNAVWIVRNRTISNPDYISYFIHATKITIPDDTLRVYTYRKLVPYETEDNNWIGCSVFVDSYKSNTSRFGSTKQGDQEYITAMSGTINWQVVNPVSDPSLPGYTNTIGYFNYITEHDDNIEVAFYSSIEHSHLYVDDNMIY